MSLHASRLKLEAISFARKQRTQGDGLELRIPFSGYIITENKTFPEDWFDGDISVTITVIIMITLIPKNGQYFDQYIQHHTALTRYNM